MTPQGSSPERNRSTVDVTRASSSSWTKFISRGCFPETSSCVQPKISTARWLHNETLKRGFHSMTASGEFSARSFAENVHRGGSVLETFKGRADMQGRNPHKSTPQNMDVVHRPPTHDVRYWSL